MSSSNLLAVLGALALVAAPATAWSQSAARPAVKRTAPSTQPPVVAAPERCTEGKTPSGRCVDPAVAVAGRDRGIVFTQPRLSFLAPPRVLPSATLTSDRLFRSPNNPITDADVEISRILGRR